MTIILFFAIFLLCLSGCTNQNNQEVKGKGKTLIEYLDNKYGKAESGGYEKVTIKCDILKNNDIIYFDNEIFVLEDGITYEYIKYGDKVYKNGQQCKKKETNITIQKVVGNYFIGKDNKVYILKSGDGIVSGNYIDIAETLSLTDENNIVNLKKIPQLSYSTYFVLRNDGNVYRTEFEFKASDKGPEIHFNKVVSEKLLFSKNNYGFIKDIFIDGWGNLVLVTDNSLYNFKTITTEECTKYADIDCEDKLVESKLYKKHRDEIKYIGNYYMVLKDNTILSTDLLLDK